MEQNYFTAIGFDINNKAYKYRNVRKFKASIEAFEKFCIAAKHNKLPFEYVNYYQAHNKEFSHRVYFNKNINL